VVDELFKSVLMIMGYTSDDYADLGISRIVG